MTGWRWLLVPPKREIWLFRGSWLEPALVIFLVLCAIPPLAVLAFILAMVAYQWVLP